MIGGNRYGAGEALDAVAPHRGVVVSVEYRLAPEHPAPAQLDDVRAAFAWATEHAAEIGIDPDLLALGGESAGGGLAAGVALAVRDDGAPLPFALLLCWPMLDDRMATTSMDQLGDDVPWVRKNNGFAWRAYLGDRFGTDDVTAHEAPGRATDLSGLPPTYLGVGSVDLFRDETVAFASTMWACGGRADLHVWDGGFHGFELLAPDAPISAEAGDARRRWFERQVDQHRARSDGNA